MLRNVRNQIKCIKFASGLGFAPDPTGGAYDAHPDIQSAGERCPSIDPTPSSPIDSLCRVALYPSYLIHFFWKTPDVTKRLIDYAFAYN